MPDQVAWLVAAHPMTTTIRFTGSGPGPQTLDGCSVELWKLLPASAEPSVIASVVPAGGSILELGAGVGRVTHRLLELGYKVTAVDNSPDMLAAIRGATTVLSDIEDLNLDQSFDAVVLGSFLIHAPAPGARAALLAACWRHVKPSGVVLIQHYREPWPASAVPGFLGEKDAIRTYVDEVSHDGTFVRMALRFEAARGTWTQVFTVEPLDAFGLHNALAQAQLSVERHLASDSDWLLARPTHCHGADFGPSS